MTRQTTQQLLQSIIDNLDEIAARGDFADAPSYVTDGLDASMRFADQAKDWLAYEAPCMTRDQWAPSLSTQQLGVAHGGSLWL